MQQPIQHRIRHRTSYRTRIQIPALKGQPGLCQELQGSLRRFAGVDASEVRARSGSVILLHATKWVSLSQVLGHIASLVQQSGSRRVATRIDCGALAAPRHDRESRGHVPGPLLLLSGLYLLYLYAKRMVSTLSPTLVSASRLLTLPALVTLAISLPVQRQALENLRRTGKADMGLISTGILYFSLLSGNTLAAFTVFWLFNLSSWLEDRIRIQTRQAVREMLSNDCRQAWLLRDGVEIEVDAADLRRGDVVVLRKGNVIPADGVVVSGQALIDEAALTGEAEPVARSVREAVLAGTVMVDGFVQVRVEQAGEDTRLAAIIRLIEQAERDPGSLQLSTRRFSQTMVPVSLGLAATAFFLTGSLMQAMAVLIITCPCALRLSTSVAVSAAMSTAARNGILIKGGRYVEIASQVDVVVVDKTGTLTDRLAEVTHITLFDRRYREDTVIRLAASAQQAWAHPLSRALVEKAKEHQLTLLPVTDSELVVGQGVRARIGADTLVLGHAGFLEANDIQLAASLEELCRSEHQQMLVALNGRLIAALGMLHRQRPGTAPALVRLRSLGVRHLVLLTGDSRLGLDPELEQAFDTVLTAQTPEDKAAWISTWKREHPQDVVAMVGDGINDTPAFAAADLSLAIGQGGADVSVEYADIVLKRGGLDQTADAIDLGRRTRKTIHQSYALALGANGAILALTTLGALSPVGGALLHNLTTVAAVANASSLARNSGQRALDVAGLNP
nr:cation-translocating P-type ATPase [uncultured Desulfobulbus sp.]